jgi:ABC-type transport system involved in cytochrome c biogenesis permease component
MKLTWQVFKLHLTLEWRAKELLVSYIALSILLSVLISFGVSSAMVSSQTLTRTFPAFFWITFLFVSSIASARAYYQDSEHGALEALLNSGFSPASLFLAKLLTLTVGSTFCCTLICGLLALFLQISIAPIVVGMALLILLVSLCYSALATLISGIATTSSLNAVLLPIMLLPLIFPLFFAALELTHSLISSGHLQTGGWWFTLLLILTTVYIGLGSVLFEYVVKE